MHDTKERLSLLWLFALLNYLYADVLALFAIVGSQDPAPHLPQWALLGSAVLMEIPIAMILASRLLPFRANRLANIIAGAIETLAVISMHFVYASGQRCLARAYVCSVLFLRDDRNCMHLGHHLEGVDLVRG